MIPAAILFPIFLKDENGNLSDETFGYIRSGGTKKEIPSSARVLLTVRTHTVAHHRGQIAFPGGRVDPTDASPLQTALRETEEEIGIHSSHIEIVTELNPVPIVRTGFQVYPYVGLVRENIVPKLNAHEIESFFFVPMQHFLDPEHSKLETIEHAGLRYQIRAYYFGDYRIWGATALMIEQFFNQHWTENT